MYLTRELPTEVKDFTEVWYDADAPGPDERGDTTKPGLIMKVAGGKRYKIGEWPTGDPSMFDPNGAIAISDDPEGGTDPPHEQDGHTHSTRCLSCTS